MPGFPRAARMLRPEEFGATLKTRPVARSSLLVLNHKRDARTETNQSQVFLRPKLGLIVPKRLLKKSVDRNTLKRIAREAFRHQSATLMPGFYVFRLHSRPKDMSKTAFKKQLRQECDWLLARVAGSK